MNLVTAYQGNTFKAAAAYYERVKSKHFQHAQVNETLAGHTQNSTWDIHNALCAICMYFDVTATAFNSCPSQSQWHRLVDKGWEGMCEWTKAGRQGPAMTCYLEHHKTHLTSRRKLEGKALQWPDTLSNIRCIFLFVCPMLNLFSCTCVHLLSICIFALFCFVLDFRLMVMVVERCKGHVSVKVRGQ